MGVEQVHRMLADVTLRCDHDGCDNFRSAKLPMDGDRVRLDEWLLPAGWASVHRTNLTWCPECSGRSEECST